MEYGIETRCIHGAEGVTRDHSYGSMGTPIYQTATFSHPGVGRSTGYDYSRESNPTRSELEKIVTSLEGAYRYGSLYIRYGSTFYLHGTVRAGQPFCMYRGSLWWIRQNVRDHSSEEGTFLFLCKYI